MRGVLFSLALILVNPSTARGKPPSATKTHQIVFTFDDGPNHGTTLRLLDLLDRYQVRAIFFVNGERCMGPGDGPRKNRRALLETRRRGHLIGNHGYQHRRLSRLSAIKQRWQIVRNEEVLERVTGIRPIYFRPPYGRVGDAAAQFLEFRRYLSVLWDIEARDGYVHDASDIATSLAQELDVADGGIVLLHDNHAWSVDAFDLMMSRLPAENARRVTAGRPALRVVDPETLLEPARQAQLQKKPRPSFLADAEPTPAAN